MNLTPFFQNVARDGLIGLDKQFTDVRPEQLVPMSSNGLSHDHVRIGDSGWLLRIPRGNQLGLSDGDYLSLQEECFKTTSQTGHAPACAGILPPTGNMPHGAMVVEEIKGRKAIRISDGAAIAKAMAAMHSIQVPERLLMMQKADTPFASQNFLISEIFGDAPERAKIDPESKILLQTKQQELKLKFGRAKRAFRHVAPRLIGGDSHPANFMITPDNKAYLVDVEFAMFDMPYIDLADASLPVTQRLDPNVVTWSDYGRKQFYQTWLENVTQDLRQHFVTGRNLAEKAVKLRTLLWLADWTAKEDSDKTHITSLARYNWDRMASIYLDPLVLKRCINDNIYPKLTPVSKDRRLQLK